MEKGLIGLTQYYKERDDWDSNSEGYLKITLSSTFGVGKSSIDIAFIWCEHCLGFFYYEDAPIDNYRMLSKGDVYQSNFYFQYKLDYEGFRKMFLT